MKYYTPKHFDPREFVPSEIWYELGDSSLLVMDYRILKTADTIREFFNRPVTINDWHNGGRRDLSGYRPHGTKTGARWSQHKFGRAIDCIVKDMSAADARKAILSAPTHFAYITCMEDQVPWLHVDCRSIVEPGVMLIMP